MTSVTDFPKEKKCRRPLTQSIRVLLLVALFGLAIMAPPLKPVAAATVSNGQLQITPFFDYQHGFGAWSPTSISALSCLSKFQCNSIGTDGSNNVEISGDPSTWGGASYFSSDNYLQGQSISSLSCLSETSCVGVGSDFSSNNAVFVGNPKTFGTNQGTEITPSAPIQGASCVSITICYGYGWNSDTGSSFLTVGNPTSWANPFRQISLGQNQITGISCPKADFCVLVGNYQGGNFFAVGSPSSWESQYSFSTNVFAQGVTATGISCVNSSTVICTLAGTDSSGGFEVTGNPMSWLYLFPYPKMTQLPGGLTPTTVSCPEIDFCAVAGSTPAGPSVDALNPELGTAQAEVLSAPVVPPFSPYRPGGLSMLRCESGETCTSFVEGADQMSYMVKSPISQLGNASATGLGGTVYPWGFQCFGSSCLLISTQVSGQVVAWSGSPTSWRPSNAKVLPMGVGNGNYLLGVDCLNITLCVGVGENGAKNFVVVGNPLKWKANMVKYVSMTAPPKGFTDALIGVQCFVTTSCIVEGSQFLTNGGSPWSGKQFFFTGSPQTWVSAKQSDHFLKSATIETCTSATACVGIGSGGRTIFTGNPALWSQSSGTALVEPIRSNGPTNLQISCKSAHFCVAIGVDATNAPVVLQGDPSTWGHQLPLGLPSLPSLIGADLTAVTCSVTTCFIGGNTPGGIFIAKV